LAGGSKMNKEQILKIAREEKEDEGKIAEANKGRIIGEVTFLVVFGFIYILNWIKGVDNDLLTALLFAYLSGENMSRYFFQKKRIYIFSYIATLLITVIYLFLYIKGLK
jgi:hypothetical protein